MTKNHLDPQSDQQLTSFLKTHQPVPPPPPLGERQAILAAIRQIPRHEPFWKKVVNGFTESLQLFLPVAATAVMIFVLVTDYLPGKNISVSEETLAAYLDFSLQAIDEIGEENVIFSEDEPLLEGEPS